MEIVYEQNNGEILWREEDTLVLEFPHHRNVTGTSVLNGGISGGIRAMFNQTCPPVSKAEELPGETVEAFLAHMAAKRGLDPQQSTGLLTAASQQNAALSRLSFHQVTVLAVATAGIDHNGGQPGDPASYCEAEGKFYLLPGTINILLSISAHLPPPTMLKAIITATEAKSAALLELLAPSCYSEELATGSGTDGVLVASDPDSTMTLTDAGHHSKLGELIGRTVREAVKKALVLETGYTPERQLNVLARLKRFGIDEGYLWDHFCQKYPHRLLHKEYQKIVAGLAGRPELVALTSCILHLADQVRWGLLPGKVAWQSARNIVASIGISLPPISLEPRGKEAEKKIIELLTYGLNELILGQTMKPSN